MTCSTLIVRWYKTNKDKRLLVMNLRNSTLTNQSGAAEAWWAHNPQPGSVNEEIP